MQDPLPALPHFTEQKWGRITFSFLEVAGVCLAWRLILNSWFLIT